MTLKQRFRRWRFKKRIRTARRTLQLIDFTLLNIGAPAWKRQQVRRDIITSDKAWVDFIDLLGEQE